MRLFAVVALLALPILGLGSQAAKADYYCCGQNRNNDEHSRYGEFIVIKKSVIFGCDAYHCETRVKLRPDVKVSAKCRNGWCRIKSSRFQNAWVLEHCLKPVEDEQEEGEGYKHKPWKQRYSGEETGGEESRGEEGSDEGGQDEEMGEGYRRERRY